MEKAVASNPFIPNYDDPPPPPPTVYKYVGPERVDVLENGCIRFTPLLGTNDLFEVRQTFERIAGPRFQAALHHEADAIESTAIDQMLVEELQKLGLDNQAAALLGPAAAKAFLGDNYASKLRDQTKLFADVVVQKMNGPGSVDRFLNQLGGSLLALAFTEVADSALMWGHYAQSSAGFVVGFDTDNPFFTEGKKGKKRLLHQIVYFDGKVDELMDDPRVCLISKTTDWSHEREWRLYIKAEDADQIIQHDGEEIHLIAFPERAVSKVIVGSRAKPGLVEKIRQLLSERFPHAKLTTMRPDLHSAKLIEVPLDT